MSHGFPQPPADLPPDLMVDFDREARRLHAALGLDGRSSRTYNDMDKIWVDQKTGGAMGRMCELFEETFLYILHSKPAVTEELEAEFSAILQHAKSKHLEMGQNISEALVNIRCAGNGEWIDASGNLLYVDPVGVHGEDTRVASGCLVAPWR